MNREQLLWDVFTARQIVAVSGPGAAARFLASRLAGLDPDVVAGDPLLIEAAQLYTSVIADPAWKAYLLRHQYRHAPADAVGSTGTRAAMAVDEPTVELPTTAYRAGLDLGHRSWSVDLDQAQAMHQQGHCGEAIRSASRALTAWTRRRPVPLRNRGVALIVGVAAMMSACLRDTDARTVLADNAMHLPAPGTADRHAFAVHALQIMDITAQPHPRVCLAHTEPAWRTALAATGDDTVAWPHRRDRWWRLLVYGPPPDP